MTTLKLTKKFLSGFLVGLTVEDTVTTSRPEKWYTGLMYRECLTDSKVRIVAVEEM